MILPEVIQTLRTVMRPHQATDVDDVLEYATHPEWSRYTDLLALPGPAYARIDAMNFVASQALLDRETHPSSAMEIQGRVVGGVNVRFLYDHRIAELGYGLSPRHWGQGLVVEAANAVIRTSFEAYPQLVRVRAKTDARNFRSLRVMEKLGMKREALLRGDRLFRGELVDEVICGLLRSEWRS